MLKKTILFMFLCLVMALSSAVATAQPPLDDLTDTHWTLSVIVGGDVLFFPVEDTPITITFGGSQLYGNGGCNSYGGDYALNDNEISIEGVFMTEMYCMNEATMGMESMYAALLSEMLTYEVTAAGKLILRTESGLTALIFTPHIEDQLITLYVGAETVTCVGEGIYECLLVRREPEGEWTYLYEHIEGFVYEEGFNYELKVNQIHVPNPPADGSSMRYELVEIIEKEQVCMDTGICAPMPTGTPTPTPTPAFLFLSIDGIIAEFGEDVVVVEAVEGRIPFVITDDTTIDGELEEGALVQVDMFVRMDGASEAIHIYIADIPVEVDLIPYPTSTPALPPEPCPPGVMDCGDPCDWAMDCTDPVPCEDCYPEPVPCDPNSPNCNTLPCDWNEPDCEPPYGEEVLLDGTIAEVGEDVVVIETWRGRLAFEMTAETMITGGDLVPGRATLISAMVNEDGTYSGLAFIMNDAPPLPQYLLIEAVVAEFSDEVIVLETADERISFEITAETVIEADLVVGETVFVEGIVNPDGTQMANRILLPTPPPPIEPELPSETCWASVVSGVSGDTVVLDGDMAFVISEDAEIVGDLVEGAVVYVVMAADSSLVYIQVLDDIENGLIESLPTPFQSQALELLDTVSSISEDGTVVINGETIEIGPDTEQIGELVENSMAFVYATRNSSSEAWSATYVESLSETTIGEVEEINNGTLVIDGEVMPMSANLRVIGNISVGDSVYVGQAAGDSGAEGITFVQPLAVTESANTEIEIVPLAVSMVQSGTATASTVMLLMITMMLVIVSGMAVKKD